MPSFVPTPILNVAYESGGAADGPPLLLLHGWPDDPRTFDSIAPALHAAGLRTFAPWLRGFGPTTFHSSKTLRSGEIPAMAQDIAEFADALGLARFAIVGHDWGARIAYAIAAVVPERVDRIATISVGWDPGELATPTLEQCRAFWYQWFMATERGASVVRRDGKAFARSLWEAWSPAGWLDDAAFDATAASFENPDWAAITVHSYRVRWGQAESDPRHAALAQRYNAVRTISVPTLMLQGGDDRCVLPASSEGKEKNFSGPYRRHVLADVGHFPTREAPARVAELLTEFLTPQ
ncbi:MAG TPA: alpha/beta hydrolase [Candidatus Baltobacteraceae bacterium]|nr:alpha/beta hydrolase [Candidatus Baltobacteraceae bacterium]